jgi:hypothetical protein
MQRMRRRAAGDPGMPSRTAVRSTILAIALLVALPAAGQLPPLVEQSIGTIEKIDVDAWSYTMTSIRGGKKTVERHDASKPQDGRWQLLLKNGESPTADEIEEYRKAKADQGERRKRRGRRDSTEVRGMIDPTSVSLVREDDARATYSFRMRAEDDEGRRIAEHVAGTLVVAKDVPYVERLEMRSSGEIKPMTGVRLDEFAMTLRFTHDAESGSTLPLSMTSRVKGRAFLVREIDEDISITYADYNRPSVKTPATSR